MSTTNAFTLDFNSAGQCTGATIGEFVGSVGSGCQTQFFNVSDSNILIPVESGSDNVLITPNVQVNPSDKTSAVAWYGEADCQTLIALGNVPVFLGVGNYETFQVIDITDVGFTNLEPVGVVELPPNATETATKGEIITEPCAVSTPGPSALPPPTTTSAKPAKMARDITKKRAVAKRGQSTQAEHMTNARRMTHGVVQSAAGQEWKFQQIASRVYRGVNPATWNNEIHKRSVTGLEPSMSQRDFSPLQPRHFPTQTATSFAPAWSTPETLQLSTLHPPALHSSRPSKN